MNSKEGKSKKEKSKCRCFNKGYRPEISRMKNTIDLLVQYLQIKKYWIFHIGEYQENPRDNSLEDQGKAHALIAIYSSPNA